MNLTGKINQIIQLQGKLSKPIGSNGKQSGIPYTLFECENVLIEYKDLSSVMNNTDEEVAS